MATKPKARSVAMAAAALALPHLLRSEQPSAVPIRQDSAIAAQLLDSKGALTDQSKLRIVLTGSSENSGLVLKPVICITKQSLILPVNLSENVALSLTVANPSVFSIRPKPFEAIVTGALKISW